MFGWFLECWDGCLDDCQSVGVDVWMVVSVLGWLLECWGGCLDGCWCVGVDVWMVVGVFGWLLECWAGFTIFVLNTLHNVGRSWVGQTNG
jgi:hypothetical protein